MIEEVLSNMNARQTQDQSELKVSGRQAFMAVLAAATLDEIKRGIDATAPDMGFSELRKPEVGLVMLRGRTGGNGPAFNIGEATVVRASLRLSSGETGFSCMLGRDLEKARLAALADALWQNPRFAARIDIELAAKVRARLDMEAKTKAAETAATKVNFFTLVRGED